MWSFILSAERFISVKAKTNQHFISVMVLNGRFLKAALQINRLVHQRKVLFLLYPLNLPLRFLLTMIDVKVIDNTSFQGQCSRHSGLSTEL